MQFLIDAQLPPALATWLSANGQTATHVITLGLERAGDQAIWDRARATKAIIITKDEDFAVRKALQPDGPPIVWIRVGNTTNPELLVHLEKHWAAVLDALRRGDGLVEID